MNTRYFALALGIVYTAIGLLGFIPGLRAAPPPGAPELNVSAGYGLLFGLYHLHQPWGLPGNILSGLLLAFTGKYFRSNWFPILLHSGQSVYFAFLILGLVLGLA